MSRIHWVARQNKLETPKEKDEVNKREVHELRMRWASCQVEQGFDFTYFFREVKLHEVLVHVFMKRGDLTFS
jgi:hypothetical protein